MRDPDQALEALLARLFVDASLRSRLRQDPAAVCREFGLDTAALPAFTAADWTGLELAARSYAHKRARR